MAKAIADALQRAVVATLKADARVLVALGGPRIYDRPPNSHVVAGRHIDGPPFPYVTIGDDDIIDDSNTCERAYEAYVTVHVWSREVGRREAKRIGDAVARALNSELTLSGFVCIHHEFRSARYFPDPDGLTTHGVLTARYLIDPA